MIEKLNPCPFCGNAPEMIENFPVHGLFTVSCENAVCKVHPHTTGMSLDEVHARWNRRAEPETDHIGDTTNMINAPLSLDELRGMGGEPVWVTNFDGSGARWGIVDINKYGVCANVDAYTAYWFGGETECIAYRHKPEGV